LARYASVMERTAWTDERLDDLSRQTDAGFERVDRDMRNLRDDMNAGFADVRGEINGLRTLMLRIGGGIMASVIVAAVFPGF
jgi:hypothetical protein